jgi:hypothetical protein
MAGVFVIFGVVFEVCMYFSMFSDRKRSEGTRPVATKVNSIDTGNTPNTVPQAPARPEDR